MSKVLSTVGIALIDGLTKQQFAGGVQTMSGVQVRSTAIEANDEV
jgi:hypothetical protein